MSKFTREQLDEWMRKFLDDEDPATFMPREKTAQTFWRNIAFKLREYYFMTKKSGDAKVLSMPKPKISKPEMDEKPDLAVVSSQQKAYNAAKKLGDEISWMFPRLPDFVPVEKIPQNIFDLERDLKNLCELASIPFKASLSEGCIAATYEQTLSIRNGLEDHTGG